ncbi:type II toxin-antitoxin system Phd/YefM family antitoxin [Pseudoalteromonas ruthenica]|uniref:type II toxin-antitoxin system Phd/YefM family antitoxin n=1 Tax=Pseudoalteromonas ruthenica TaxID=151081 RepID=UPI00110B923A|nr:type II toxin-antitoxin system Phd/YefM family antitoxin [Pseudoalteromonas ruthenica]TMP23792.1 prevent-host-death protein [Pseudoalteromonas ruthenica]
MKTAIAAGQYKAPHIVNISDMKAKAATLRDELGARPLFVTQNGHESLVVQTHEAYQYQQEKLAFMELVINARKDIDEGRTVPVDDFLASI